LGDRRDRERFRRHLAAVKNEPRYWDDYKIGQKYPLGSVSFTEQEIMEFARQFDPQSFHVDREAAARSMFGGIIASGWHVASKMMRLFVDNYVDHRTALGSPGLDELRWLRPVRGGDTLTGTVEITQKTPSKSRPHMGIVQEQWTVVNQKGETVMTTKGMNMVRRRPQ
jgi:acyl dehydratase